MKLLLDIGNSRIKWGWFAAGEFLSTGAALLQPGNPGAALRVLFAASGQPDEIRLANVAGGEVGTQLASLVAERYGRRPLVARAALSGAGVRNGYRDSGQLGVDRWLALCAAWQRYALPLCVVDAGTATTIDRVGAGGVHLGGLILPGIALMQSALLGGTGDLARLSGQGPTVGDARPQPSANASRVSLGHDTATAIRLGALQSTACLVAACMEVFDGAAAGDDSVLVVTGGAAPDVLAAAAPLLQRRPGLRIEQRPFLVLEGLALEPACFDPPP